MHVEKATRKHIPGIVSLLDRYYVDHLSVEEKQDGFVSARFSEEEMEKNLENGNIAVVAVHADRVLGVAFVGPWESWIDKPMFSHMAAGLPENQLNGDVMTVENSCLYGPVCLDLSVRGKGIFEALFAETLHAFKDRYPYMIAFISKSNPRSFAAHTRKTPLEVTGEFTFGTESYYYLACSTQTE